jgi:hypothetical protein
MAYPQQQGLPPANQPLPQQQYQVPQFFTWMSDFSFSIWEELSCTLPLACNMTSQSVS